MGFKNFSIFFRLKPAPGHGLSENTKFSHTAFVVWEPIRLGQTDGRTDRQTDGRRDPISWSAMATKTPSEFDKLLLRLNAHHSLQNPKLKVNGSSKIVEVQTKLYLAIIFFQ